MIGMITIFYGCEHANENVSDEFEDITISKEENVIDDLSEEDFMLENEDFSFCLGMKYEDFALFDIDELEPYRDKTYYFIVHEDYKIKVAMGDKSIFFLDLITSKYETTRGISVGDSLSDMLESYGHDYSQSEAFDKEFYTYYYDGKNLTFVVDENQTIISVTFDSL
jgi:hypothetical protein